MQVSEKKVLTKMVRYYQDLIDLNILEKGIFQGMLKQIKTLKLLNVNKNEILEIIKEYYDFSEEEIREYL